MTFLLGCGTVRLLTYWGIGVTIAIYPGSFDPLTNGHTDVVRRCLKIFDRVIVGVLENPSKHTLFSVEERLALIRSEFADCGERVSAQSFSGLLVDFARRFERGVVVRGLRAISDFDYEAQMALLNKTLCEDLETLFLMAREKNSYISSSLVKQVAQLGGSVEALVPKEVAVALRGKFSTATPTR
jgi:pantetheine-phosphate adenylyltransferase